MSFQSISDPDLNPEPVLVSLMKKVKDPIDSGSGSISLSVFMVVAFFLQGGSNISGTLSKLHCRIKISPFYYLFWAKLSQLSVKAETKTNSHFPAKINQQEATRAVIVSRHRAAGVH